MHPLAQDFLNNFSLIIHPQGFDQDNCATMVSSFRRSDEAQPILVLSLAEGFGTGRTAEEVCQIALQALRNEFVKAESQAIDEILVVGMATADRAVYEHACVYEEEGEIGVWMLAAVIEGNRCYVMQVGRGSVYIVRRSGRVDRVTPYTGVGQNRFLGMEPKLALPYNTDVRTVPMHSEDKLLLVNGTLGDAISEETIQSTLSRFEVKRAVDRLVQIGKTKLGQLAKTRQDLSVQEPSIALGALAVEMPGGEGKSTKTSSRYGRMAIIATGALVLAISLIWALFGHKSTPVAAPVVVTPVPSITDVVTETPTTEVLSLPTRSSTFTSIPAISPSLTNTATRVLPSATLEPTEVPTSTPSPLPPTEEVAPTLTLTAPEPTAVQEPTTEPEPTELPTMEPTPISMVITLLEPIQDDNFKRGDKIRFKWEVETTLDADRITFKIHICAELGPCYDFTSFGPNWTEFDLSVDDLLNEISGEKYYWGVIAYQDQIEITRSDPAALRIFNIVERPKKESGGSTGKETPTPRP